MRSGIPTDQTPTQKHLSPCVDTAVIEAARALSGLGRRTVLGIVGPPGSGKSSVSEALAPHLGAAMQVVPMDGFHLAQCQLERLGRAGRKGAPDTFDGEGYLALLVRLKRAAAGETIYAPGFYRDIEEPIAASIAVPPETPLVVTEGNYLLLREPPWPRVAALLDEIWYLDVETDLRERWLIERHVHFGKSEAHARDFVAKSDRPNAERIEASRHRADRFLCWDGATIRFSDGPL